jgi:hypothetical protein
MLMRLLCLLIPALSFCQSGAGLFDQFTDVGSAVPPGSVEHSLGPDSYRITGGGSNMWEARDEFHLLWKKVSGDAEICTYVQFTGAGTHPHRKAGAMFRESLEPDSPYADIAVHGNGLAALQFRRKKGGLTEEVRSSVQAPERVRIARHGDIISLEVARAGEPFRPIAALTVALPETMLAGLFVCSHDAARSETAIFRNVTLQNPGVIDPKNRTVESTLEAVRIDTGERRIIRRALEHVEAPNWSRDGSHLIYSGGGALWRIPATGGTPVRIDTGGVDCNNDHGISPDGALLAISGRIGKGQSQIYVMPAAGGKPRLITPLAPSYWHGWSPDGRILTYCASRGGEYDIYTMPVEGGQETRLTTAAGLDDGPDYSPDGRWIYFNSERTGLMRIWRMRPDGSGQELISRGPESADWFAHPSPDGRWIAYTSYDRIVKGHPANKDVVLKLAPSEGGYPRTLVTLIGGQGTMNVPSWSPDSKEFAFTSYRLVYPAR